MDQRRWDAKPYYSLNSYFRSVYGEKIYKLALDGGCTCPVRDGTIDTRGCIFCSAGGSGEFAAGTAERNHPDIEAQINAGRELILSKFSGAHFVAYFQPYTNTYADVRYLRDIFTRALMPEGIVGLSIATRPDCLGDEVLDLLRDLKSLFPEKFIWIELGLQTIHPASIRYIRRGYDNTVFETAILKLHDLQIPIIVHTILGLPGETREQMLSTIEYINTFPIFGIKLQLLHVLKDTDLAADYAARKFDTLTRDEYIDLVIDCIEHLSPETVIHRLTGDGPRSLLIAPDWSLDKKATLNLLLKEMERRGSYQGCQYLYNPGNAFRPI